jgi:hypothetical protein
MPLEKLIAFLSYLFPCPIVIKEAFQLGKEVFFSRHLDGSSCLNQTPGDIQEMKHIRAEENTFFKKQRLERVVPPHGDKASTHKDQCPQTVDGNQFAHRIEEDHLGPFSIRSAWGR